MEMDGTGRNRDHNGDPILRQSLYLTSGPGRCGIHQAEALSQASTKAANNGTQGRSRTRYATGEGE